ncbi:hypothetical protein [Hoeflea ulvae]|uniref:Uncharacterized protein n=1 Tax=Hoeflea ulvae TaxID=2983764 RepID=A0ABT3YGN8_9HYPH|nr:hypothetical protein [Hoeflea ulvae]MCY0095065.1 hypothetical protein [Hoeflea ulvae]
MMTRPASVTLALLALTCSLLALTPARAGEADVVSVSHARASDGTYRFDVTVRHADDGWEHYADKWQVTGADGAVLGERVLLHPHDTEQPFTRSQSGIVIPPGTARVTVRAHDRLHGWGGKEVIVELSD